MAPLSALPLLAIVTLPRLMGVPEGVPEQGGGGIGRAPPSVVVVKSGRLRAFQDLADAFQDNCRVPVQQLYIVDESSATGLDRMRLQTAVQSARVLVAVGQPAIEVVSGVRAHIVYALVPDPPVGAIGTNNFAPPSLVFRAMTKLQPAIKRIGVVYSPRAAQRMERAREAARAQGIELVERVVHNSPEAIRAMHAMIDVRLQQEGQASPVATAVVARPGGGVRQASTGGTAPPSVPPALVPALPVPPLPIEAMWVGADPQLIDTQVTEFLMQMQIEWQVPVLTCTRQQVLSGALLAVDWAPDVVGRHLAWQVTHLLDDPDHLDPVMRDHPSAQPDVVVNAQTARRLGISLDQVRGLAGWKIIE